MTNQSNKLDRVEALAISNTEAIAQLTIRQVNTQAQLNELSQEMRELTSNVDRVLGRSAILDDVLLELRDSHEELKQNFLENQRTNNAALNSLEAILLRLIRNFP